MSNRVFNSANMFSAELTAPVAGSDLSFPVDSTLDGPGSPAYLVIDPANDSTREIIFCDGTFDGTHFRTSSLTNRFLVGSSATSATTHDTGTRIAVVTVAQYFRDIHDRITQHDHSGGNQGAAVAVDAVNHDSLLNRGNATAHPQFILAFPGMIVPYRNPSNPASTLTTIPAGWALCDGTNGTPDLTDRFLVGAGGLYGIDAIGGASQVALSSSELPSHSHSNGSLSTYPESHSHSGSVGSDSHSHSGSTSSDTHIHDLSVEETSNVDHNHSSTSLAAAGPGGNGPLTQKDTASDAHSHSLSINSDSHSHSLSSMTSNTHDHQLFGSTGATGSGSAHENRPPYFGVVFIMRL